MGLSAQEENPKFSGSVFLRLRKTPASHLLSVWPVSNTLSTRDAGRASQGYNLLGLVNVPVLLAPFGSLILTSILIPRASFVGHLSGILAGYLIATGAFDWLTPWWFLSLLGWAIAGTNNTYFVGDLGTWSWFKSACLIIECILECSLKWSIQELLLKHCPLEFSWANNN